MVKVWMAVGLLVACRGSERHAIERHAIERPAIERPAIERPAMEIDQPDPAGDHAVVTTELDGSTQALPGEPPLRAFSCKKPIGGKRENGQLEITFLPTTPADVSFRIEFRGLKPSCNSTTAVRLAAGHLNDGVPGPVRRYRCRRSALSAFAVSCGPYLGSDLNLLVHGNGWGRTVALRMPLALRMSSSFLEGIPDADVCTLPFVRYDVAQHAESINNDELVFDLADCHWES